MLGLKFEASRLLANLSKCIMYNPFPELTAEYETKVRLVLSNEIEKVYECIEELEDELREKAGEFEFGSLRMKFEPFFFLVDRIVCRGDIVISPELQFYLCKDNITRYTKKIRKTELKIVKNRNPSKIYKLNELEGEMLGYPSCCISSFSKRKRLRNTGKSVKSPEEVIADEFIEMGLHEVLDAIFAGEVSLKEAKLPDSLFAFNFYPCTLMCKRAGKTGEKCKNALEELQMGNVFKAGVVAAMCDILEICIKMKKIEGKNRSYCYAKPEEIMKKLI